MATFAELRERLSLDGKQFERVCKWFLETDPRYSERLVNVWLWDDWPGRWGPDCGIDLVAEDQDGRTWAIQSKCYDPNYPVTRDDMDRFLTESIHEDIDHRLLIATTNTVGANARRAIRNQNTVIPVSQLLLHDLETAPVVWPSDPDRLTGGKARKPFTPRRHQRTAINNVTKNLGRRGQMISACGTGKTLAALWISERLEAKRTLVLVPSLTLLSQTVSEWLANTKEPFAYLPVCSDDTVSRGNDAAVVFTSDLEYPVTTNPDDIATFLRKRGRQVVFSTYQSSHRIAEAQTHNRVPGFDLVIADEAHRCAGKVSSAYGTVLDDEVIRAKKRLFMTATPRTFTARVQKKADDEGIEVASMDDEAVFGPVVHQLNFGEAIEKELLSDYQVVVVGVDNSRYKQMVDKRRIVKADKHINTDAETLAKHIALAKVIRDYDLRRTITFHSRIKTASEFANMLTKVVSWMPPRQRPKVEIVTDHVSGEMSTGERNRRLNRLRNIESGQSAVLTNAQCLSEGIDVPALDGVAFIDPRRSQVDIVQAVGRAIRLSPDKKIGTIVIPVFLSGTDDPDTALSQSEFEPVWSIVRALRSHDDALGEALDGIRLNMGKKGSGGGSPPPIVFDLPKSVSAKFVEAFRTRLVEKTTSTWSFNFGLLQRFVEREGHARPLVSHVEILDTGSYRLGGWVDSCRNNYRRGSLESGRIVALEALTGWAWDPFEADFELRLQALRQFVTREGHALVKTQHIEIYQGDEVSLGWWVNNRRAEYARGELASKLITALEAIPAWEWYASEAVFQRKFAALEQFAEREGHARVPRKHVETFQGEDTNLGQWVSDRRNRKQMLSDDRKAMFDVLPGWVWDTHEAEFQKFLAALKQFLGREGSAFVPVGHVESFEGEKLRLGAWGAMRRSDYRTGDLPPDRTAVLEALSGWTWDPDEARFQKFLAALRQFVAREGHARMIQVHVETFEGEELKLGTWVNGRRAEYVRGDLPAARAASFEAVTGWVWDPLEEDFQHRLAALKEFAARVGHARVPQAHVETFEGEDLNLGTWVSARRMAYRTEKLSEEHTSALEAVHGWVWNLEKDVDRRTFGAIEQFVAREGHARVLQRHVEIFEGEELKLGIWVANRRRDHLKKRLSEKLIEDLEALPGWVWSTR